MCAVRLLTVAESILNRFLQLDPESKNALEQLSGKVIEIESRPFTRCYLLISDTIRLLADYNGPVDLVLRGSFLDFTRLSFLGWENAMTGMSIQVSGDMDCARQFHGLFAQLDIDWEEQLSRIVGDTVGYPLAQFFKSIHYWAQESVQSAAQNLTDYLQFELSCLVSEAEVQLFCSEVDDLRDDVARLQVRIGRLQKGYHG